MSQVTTLVFDLGGVLIDWNPRYLYRRLLPDEAAVERFLTEVCPHSWNQEMDAGKPIAQGVAERVALFPEHEALIRAYYPNWDVMNPSALAGTVALLERLLDAGRPCYALSNWSAETFARTRPRFPFLAGFRGIVLSGEEGVCKPDPRLYQILFERYGLDPAACLFVDDVGENIEAAGRLGMEGLLFTGPEALEAELVRRELV